MTLFHSDWVLLQITELSIILKTVSIKIKQMFFESKLLFDHSVNKVAYGGKGL